MKYSALFVLVVMMVAIGCEAHSYYGGYGGYGYGHGRLYGLYGRRAYYGGYGYPYSRYYGYGSYGYYWNHKCTS